MTVPNREKGETEMIQYRLVAKCGAKSRAKICTDIRIPQVGELYNFNNDIGEVTIDEESFGQGTSVVMVTVTPGSFSKLTMVNGWSAVE